MTFTDERRATRSAGRKVRQALSGPERKRAERQLIRHLQSLDALRHASVGVFIAHDGEPDLSPLVDWLWGNGVTVALPVLVDDPNDYSMRFVPWERDDLLATGRYDIPVPPDRPAIAPSTLLVSLVGFDRRGNRIGRGGGFFDRYLAGTTATVIGVGFERQRFERIPVEAHDVALPLIVTDLGIRYRQVTS